ncbi:VOC family protein [uncultured Paraglaciecola sp.]|uniref:VOC family protein n=1 Tax=uncultured Paraglaciecola sp. TaxID=1765024 RepID=UPI0026203DE2|nr:VOC family protein [uncultured Paraglaciecola sp.]
MTSKLEHINLTVQNPKAAANILGQIFDWKIRWSGAALDNGFTIHLGSDNTYLALYCHEEKHFTQKSHKTLSNLNHIGIQVDDLDAVEQKVKNQGLKTYNHGDYEPGRRFYFDLEEGIEIEVVSY